MSCLGDSCNYHAFHVCVSQRCTTSAMHIKEAVNITKILREKVVKIVGICISRYIETYVPLESR